MTEAQKEEEQLIKTTFQFYERNKGSNSIELFELPMILEGKSRLLSKYTGEIRSAIGLGRLPKGFIII